MKRKIIFILIVMIAVMLSACSEGAKIKGTRFPQFEDLFINKLPKEVENSSVCDQIYIEKSKSILGDPNYVISFNLCFSNLSTFQSHIRKIDASLAKELKINGKIYYVFHGSKEQLSEYTNLEIWDGYSFVYEIIAIDAELREVSYLYAYVWDYWKSEFLISKLQYIFCNST